MIHWARFFRIPLLPTVWCHLYAASVMVGDDITQHPWLLVAFSCVYLFGMGDNDRADVARDLENNPSRPLAAGVISITQATYVLTFILLIGGFSVYKIEPPHQAKMVAVSLVAAWCYNRYFKAFALPGALCLAVARGSIYYSFSVPLHYALILAAYTLCVTLWSTTEEKYPKRKKITLLLLLMLPVLDFILIICEKGMTQRYAFFLLAMPIVCRFFVLALSPKK